MQPLTDREIRREVKDLWMAVLWLFVLAGLGGILIVSLASARMDSLADRIAVLEAKE